MFPLSTAEIMKMLDSYSLPSPPPISSPSLSPPPPSPPLSLLSFLEEKKMEKGEGKEMEEKKKEGDGCPELEKLISNLKKKHQPGIKNPDLLIESLQELNDFIGLKSLKKSVAMQIMSLIESINKKDFKVGMLNTVLYGPPGIGKTSIALKLGKIWDSLGYLEKNVKKDLSFLSGYSTVELIQIVSIFILVLQIGATFIMQMHDILGTKGLCILLALLIIAGICLYFYDQKRKKNLSPDEKDRNIVTVVSREEMVAEYVGQTAVKTRNLCNNNLGRVLFIDEAYSIITNYLDPYGPEALNELNKFMSENGDSLVVIFAGYEDKLKETIFKAQPGLESRIMWKFNCDPYTGEELGRIFLSQMKGKNIPFETDLSSQFIEMIKEKSDVFTGFGRDTERLCNYIKTILATKNFNQGGNSSLTVEDLKEGLATLEKNNIKTSSKNEDFFPHFRLPLKFQG